MTASRGEPPPGSRWSRGGTGAFFVAPIVPLVAGLLVPEVWIVPGIHDPLARLAVRALEGLTLLALALLMTGAYLAWRPGAVQRRSDPSPSTARQTGRASPDSRPEDPAAQAFLRMVTRVEGQAQEVDALATRLEGAYQDLAATTSRLKQLSFRDEVTGLYNRRFFSLRLEEEISRYRRFSRPVSMVLLDLDGFKTVNDRLGHPVGDEALRDIARILTRHSRGINVIARFGGDEFAVLLVETPKAGARLYADRIRHIIASHLFSQGVRVTASFGVSSLPEDELIAPEELVRSADEALYAAKRGGKNRVVAYDTKSIESSTEPLA